MKRALFAVLSFAVLASCARSPGDIEASGTIEATSVLVSSRSSGVILNLDVEEGSRVTKGDVLARIDHASLDLQLAQARAGVGLARAEFDLLANGARLEDIAGAQDALTQANEALQSADQDNRRTQSLFAAGAATQKQREDAQARYVTAKAQASAADQALKKLLNYARPEEVRAASARLDQAAYAVKLLEKSVQDCTVTAPTDGVVTERLVEEGELVMPGMGLFVIDNLDVMKLTIYVSESDLGDIRVGQEARVSIDSRPGAEFAGKVTYLSPEAEFTPRDVQTKDERVKLVFAVRIQIANPDGVFKPGMPADAKLARGGEPRA